MSTVNKQNDDDNDNDDSDDNDRGIPELAAWKLVKS